MKLKLPWLEIAIILTVLTTIFAVHSYTYRESKHLDIHVDR